MLGKALGWLVDLLRGGERLADVAALRKGLGLTADEVADLIPGGSLRANELASGAHLIERHVGLGEAELVARLADPNIRAASSFFDLETAEAAAAATLRENAGAIERWLAGTGPSVKMTSQLAAPVGIAVARGATVAVPASRVELVLVKGCRCAVSPAGTGSIGGRCARRWRGAAAAAPAGRPIVTGTGSPFLNEPPATSWARAAHRGPGSGR